MKKREVLYYKFSFGFTRFFYKQHVFSKAHNTESLNIFTIFVSISRPTSIYVVSMRSTFHFHLRFHFDQSYNLMNTDILVHLIFLEHVVLFLDDAVDKE